MFVKASAWAAIVAADLERFSDSRIICKFASLFTLHIDHWFEIVFAEGMLAVFVMLSNTGVAPSFSLYGTFMLIPSEIEGTSRLANVGGCA